MDKQEFYLNLPSSHECFKLPEKDKKYLLKDNFLNEYFNEEDKAQVRSNLGITPLLDELKSIILAKLFDEEGNITFDLEPHEDAYNKVLSSAVIYSILLKYYTKQELDEWRENFIDEIYSRIQELRDNIHVDDDLDLNSEYPVLNKVLYNIFDLIFDAYSRLSKIKADKEELLNYYTADDIDRIIENFYTKEQSDNVSSSINERLAQAAEYLSQSILLVANDLQLSVINGRNQLTQAVDNLNSKINQLDSLLESSISDVDNKVDQLVSNLNQSITDLSNKVDSDLSLAVNDINEEIDQQVSNLNQSINNVDNELDLLILQVNQSIDELDDKVDLQVSNINQSIDSLDDKIDLLISNVNLSISSVDNKIDLSINNLDDKIDLQVSNLNLSISNTNSLISLLGQLISDVANNATVNGDNKTIKKENGVLSTLLRIHQLTDQEIDDESVESAYELQNSSGEKIGDRIVINKPSNNSQIIELLLELILQLQESQLKYIIIDESAYEQLTSYVQGAIYLVLEDGDSVNHTSWKLGDGLPIILSEEWKFGDNLPIILSREQEIDPYNNHDYIEINGVKWATMNIGANNITDFGLYFAWGEIIGYNDIEIGNNDGLKKFVLSDYKYSDGSSMTKYNTTDNLVTLELTDDAAHINWGGNWRIPTDEEYTLLINSTTRSFINDYNGTGVSGYLFTDKTDNTKQLFLPSAGRCYNGEIDTYSKAGNYWANKNDPNFPTYATHLFLTKNAVNVSNAIISAMGRYNGASIRAVCDI